MSDIDLEAVKLFQKNRFFRGLSEKQLQELVPLVQKTHVSPGEYVIQEGDLAQDLFVLIEGEVEVIKKEPLSEQRHRLTLLSTGDVFGEMALIENGSHSATIRALRPSTLLSLSIQQARQLTSEKTIYSRLIQKLHESIEELETLPHDPPIYSKLSTNLASDLSLRLRQAHEVTVESLRGQLHEAKTRVALGRFMINILTMLVMYVFSLRAITCFGQEGLSTAVISIPLIFCFAVGIIVMMKRNGYPLSFYGITWKNAKTSAKEGVLFSVPIIAAAVLIKWFMIHVYPKSESVPLFHLTLGINPSYVGKLPLALLLVLPLVYLLFTPIQELISRGAMQSSLQEFLTGPYKKWSAILVSNLLFSVTHIHVSLGLAVAVFLPGLVWGWMFERHRSLVGVSVSHMIVGGFAYFIMGVQGVLTINP